MQSYLDYVKTLLKLLLGRGVRKSYSQFGEDAIVQALCKRTRGTYLDIGTYHPVLYSNTYALYRRGWRGVVVDPNVSLAPLYALMRPRDTFITAAVGQKEGSGTYYTFSDGAYNTFNAESLEACKKLPWLRYLGSVESRIISLSRIVRENNIEEIDFLTIDVEGNDFEVLQSYDWSVRPRVIAIESGDFNPDAPQENEIYRFLRSKNYRLTGLSGATLLWIESEV